MNAASCLAEDVETMSNVCPSLFLQDKAQPETQATVFGDVAFKATLAQDTPGGLPLVRQPGSDGFTLSSSPLFQVGVSLVQCVHNFSTARPPIGYCLCTTLMQTQCKSILRLCGSSGFHPQCKNMHVKQFGNCECDFLCDLVMNWLPCICLMTAWRHSSRSP